MPNLVNEYKTSFQAKGSWPWNFPKGFFPYWSYPYTYFRVCQKPKFNVWSDKYWCKAQKSIIWRTNTKPFFWESKVDLETFQKVSLHIGVNGKLNLKSFKSLNPIFEVYKYWYKAQKCIIWSTNTKPFF